MLANNHANAFEGGLSTAYLLLESIFSLTYFRSDTFLASRYLLVQGLIPLANRSIFLFREQDKANRSSFLATSPDRVATPFCCNKDRLICIFFGILVYFLALC